MDIKSTKDIEKMLKLLNVRGRCSLHQTAYAVTLVLQDKEYLSHITKGLYQDVAKKHKTNWINVERNIRGARDMVWNEGRELLEEISRGELIARPSNTEFLNMLAEYMESRMEAAILRLNNLKQKFKELQDRIEILESEKSNPKE